MRTANRQTDRQTDTIEFIFAFRMPNPMSLVFAKIFSLRGILTKSSIIFANKLYYKSVQEYKAMRAIKTFSLFPYILKNICCVLQKKLCPTYLLNPLTPNDPYMGRTAPLTSKRCILYIYSTNIRTEYFKHAAHYPFFPLQTAVYFIMLPFLVPVLFTF
jgi:hypothetical protein